MMLCKTCVTQEVKSPPPYIGFVYPNVSVLQWDGRRGRTGRRVPARAALESNVGPDSAGTRSPPP